MSRAITKGLQLEVFHRAGWHCTYCSEPLFFSPTLKLLEALAPGHGYYDAHGRRGAMLALLENRCACCDHVSPYSRGGETVADNLVAACFECNRTKSDGLAPLVLESKDQPRPQHWDGLSSLYPLLPGADPDWCRALASFGPP
ncbi:MAG: HNH endonuclease [Planctomycetes bacterium]|nr:HNH endonuclease [Planctomycetota bacterium]